MGSLYDDASQAHSLESSNQERCSTCQTIHRRGQDCPDCKIPANQETNLQIGDWVRFNSVEVGIITEIDGEYALVSNMEREYKIRLTDCQLVYRRQDRLPLTWE